MNPSFQFYENTSCKGSTLMTITVVLLVIILVVRTPLTPSSTFVGITLYLCRGVSLGSNGEGRVSPPFIEPRTNDLFSNSCKKSRKVSSLSRDTCTFNICTTSTRVTNLKRRILSHLFPDY